MSTKTNGQIAYEAYGEHTGWKSLANGKPIPQWLEVKLEIKEAWEKSAAVLVASQGKVVDPQLAEFKAGLAIEVEGQLLPEGASEAMCAGRGLAVELRERFSKSEQPGQADGEMDRLAEFLGRQGMPGFEGSPAEVAIKIISQYRDSLEQGEKSKSALVEERDEILARIMNELSINEGGFEAIMAALGELKAAASRNWEAGARGSFVGENISCKRTGRLIEIRLPETGAVEMEKLDRVVATLNAAGIGNH